MKTPPEQIEEFLQLMRCVLLCSSDQRMAQALLNALRDHPGFPDIWEVKDNDMIEYLKKYLKNV